LGLSKYFRIEIVLEILYQTLVRGKGTHYRTRPGGWIGVSGCGVATYGTNNWSPDH